MDTEKDSQTAGEEQRARSESTQLQASLLAKEFAKIYIRDMGDKREVRYVMLLDDLTGAQAEGWQTGLALDASASMREWFGKNLCGEIRPRILKKYKKKGWAKYIDRDGVSFLSLQEEAYADAIRKGELKYTENIVEPYVRDIAAYLAAELDDRGQVSLAYWACGDGAEFEVIGDVAEADCNALEVTGPSSKDWGTGTKLAPVMRHFVEHFKGTPRVMCVFITDGRLDDMQDVTACTVALAKAIEAGEMEEFKCVLIGVGEEIDEQQMSELDDLDTGTEIDIWDQKIAADMRAVSEIIGELVTGLITESAATFYDDEGNVAYRSDGLPAQGSFTLPASSQFFELEVSGQRIRQPLVAEGV